MGGKERIVGFLLITLLTYFSKASTQFGGLVVDRPKIRVLSYKLQSDLGKGYDFDSSSDGGGGLEVTPPDLRLGVDSEEGEVAEWSLPPNTTEIRIECKGKSGPVEWDHLGKGKFHHLRISSVRETGDFWSPSTYTHTSTLTLPQITDQVTGNFVCRSVEKPGISNSFYLFVPQERRPILRGTYTRRVREGEKTVLIPCRDQRPQRELRLFKRDEEGEFEEVVGEKVAFSPFEGFRLPFSQEVFGEYECRAEKDKGDLGGSGESGESREKGALREGRDSPGYWAFPTSEEVAQAEREKTEGDRDYERIYLPHDPRRRRPAPVASTLTRRQGVVQGPPRRPLPPRRPMRPQPFPLIRVRPFFPRRPPYTHTQGPLLSYPTGQGNGSKTAVPFSGEKEYFYPPLTSHDPFPPQRPHPHPQLKVPSIFRKRPRPAPSTAPPSPGDGGTLSTNSGEEKEREKATSSQEDTEVSTKKPKRTAAQAILSTPSLLPQTMQIVSGMSCVLKKVMLGPDARCDGPFDQPQGPLTAGRKPGKKGSSSSAQDLETLLAVTVTPPPGDLFYPPEEEIWSPVPFFLKWKTRSTDFAKWAEVNHTLPPGTWKVSHPHSLEDGGVHSMEVFNLPPGAEGRISVPFIIEEEEGGKKEVQWKEWKFHVIEPSVSSLLGLSWREEGRKHVFVCKGPPSSGERPTLTLTPLLNGCPSDLKKRKFRKKSVIEEDCGSGCASIRTDIDSGLVSCRGQGLREESLRYPPDAFCTGRPFFVERGQTKNLTLPPGKKRLTLPCVINNPDADIFLFHETLNGTISDVTDSATFDLKTGFSLNLEKLSSPSPWGTFVCTSSLDLSDLSDSVTYVLSPAPSHVFNPPQRKVAGAPPFRFVWESEEELEVEDKGKGNFYSGVFASPEGSRAFVGTFEIFKDSVTLGDKGTVNVVTVKGKKRVHTWEWEFQEGKQGLWVDRKLNVFRCRDPAPSPGDDDHAHPHIFGVECETPNSCSMKRKYFRDLQESSSAPEVSCGRGCSELKIWKDRPSGFVQCNSRDNPDGLKDSLTYFVSDNSTLLSEEDDLSPFKSVEITSPVKRLKIGDKFRLSCRGRKYFYSAGFLWAIEMRNGSKRFLDVSVGKETETRHEIRSEVELLVSDKEMKAVWCHAPKIDSNGWGTASQLLYFQQ